MLAEFTADVAVLWVALRTKHRIRSLRLFTAAAAGAIFSACASLCFHSHIAYLLAALCATPIMLLICIGKIRISEFLCASSSMYVVSAMIAAAANIIGKPGLLSVMLASFAGCSVISQQRRWLDTWETELELEAFGGNVKLKTLIDTGNRLSEPVSGLPVIVAEEAALGDILPREFYLHEDRQLGFRRLAYGGVGGSGTLRCFMPEKLTVNGEAAGDIWVAAYPGKLPGKFSALAPPALVGKITNNRKGGRKYVWRKIGDKIHIRSGGASEARKYLLHRRK